MTQLPLFSLVDLWPHFKVKFYKWLFLQEIGRRQIKAYDDVVFIQLLSTGETVYSRWPRNSFLGQILGGAVNFILLRIISFWSISESTLIKKFDSADGEDVQTRYSIFWLFQG